MILVSLKEFRSAPSVSMFLKSFRRLAGQPLERRALRSRCTHHPSPSVTLGDIEPHCQRLLHDGRLVCATQKHHHRLHSSGKPHPQDRYERCSILCNGRQRAHMEQPAHKDDRPRAEQLRLLSPYENLFSRCGDRYLNHNKLS